MGEMHMKFNKFSEVEISKPDFAKIIEESKASTIALKNAKTAEEAIKVIYDDFKASDEIDSNYSIASIRHTVNTNDEFYSGIIEEYDQQIPVLSQYGQEFTLAVLGSKFRKELEKEFGTYYFQKIEAGLKTFKPEIIPELQKENVLVSEYSKIMGSATVDFRGETMAITKIGPFRSSKDRATRKEADEAYWKFFADNDEKLGKLYGELVEIRNTIAKKLGFSDFTEVGYLRLGRLDYNAADVKGYRDEVYRNIVPLTNKLFKRQAERLNIDDIKYYDYTVAFQSGNPLPNGDAKELVKKAREMYSEMNPVASKYFNFMDDHQMMDLESKKGKVPGGYMTYIPSLESSYIFSNFNGTKGDVDVLTHEFGHSLQGFLGAEILNPSLRAPGYECCEIHSMSMEFFAYPWMKMFFDEQDEKYRFSHLVDAICFIPYGVSVDEFQHFVYANPKATHQERKAEWRKIEKKYLPHLKYEGENDFLASGGFWMRQLHIYQSPFYYIDYTIAQVCAFSFFVESLENYEEAFKKYLAFDKLGGKYPFKELLAKGEVPNPMVKGTIAKITPVLEKYLDQFDDSKF